MDCVTTRKNSEIFPKNVEILFGGRRTEKKLGKMTKKVVRNSDISQRKCRNFLCGWRTGKKLGKMTKKVVRNSEISQRKCRNFLCGPRTETKFVKWSATRKRLRTAALDARITYHSLS